MRDHRPDVLYAERYLQCVNLRLLKPNVERQLRLAPSVHHVSNFIILHRDGFEVVSAVVLEIFCLMRRFSVRDLNDIACVRIVRADSNRNYADALDSRLNLAYDLIQPFLRDSPAVDWIDLLRKVLFISEFLYSVYDRSTV